MVKLNSDSGEKCHQHMLTTSSGQVGDLVASTWYQSTEATGIGTTGALAPFSFGITYPVKRLIPQNTIACISMDH
eukprot:CAMPEP_0119101692 /NCGR_PEP_ID=MMETSP1180-20130426/679_1 /TAXON_ID=3052 ORGANISM="Chlamydomonas cf sp, Strain CCMP681" /NCGR_SAMPLE_ID=MMETSP1180 /ASSEMBLY_ACC=CAM_ASM_000741 /LENGTH=74 /DNA_ID=CAMNT_0007085853 /DNA_START=978 /DNA_END=1202 /DNA_ORIENTATION=-